MVGPNEAGKTVLLEALQKLNPPEGIGLFDPLRDYPRSEYNDITTAVHEDFQSTVWGLSEADGDLLERYNYTDPYGVSDSEDSDASSLGAYASEVFHRKRLHGGFVEKVSGLYDVRNRWLDPSTGGWLSRDPLIGLSSRNAYEGFLGSPTSKVDYMGLTPTGSVDNGGCFPAGAPDCPADEERKKLCEEFAGSGMIGKPGFDHLFSVLCAKSTRVACRCTGCEQDNEPGTDYGAVHPDRPKTIFVFYEIPPPFAAEFQGGSIRGGAFPNLCCPCTNRNHWKSIRQLLVHEAMHVDCFAKYGTNDPRCFHDAGGRPPSDYNFLANDVLGCVSGASPKNCDEVDNEIGTFFD